MAKTTKLIPKATVILWSYSANNEEKHPVKVRVTYSRGSRYYSIAHTEKGETKKLFLSESEYNEIQDRKLSVRGKNKSIRDAIDKAMTDANNAISKVTINGKQFTWERFESEYISGESKQGLLKIFENHLADLHHENRIGTWKSYRNAYTALCKFRGAQYKFENRKAVLQKPAKDFHPIDLTVKFLKDFENHLKKSGAGRNTIAIYMRALKVIYNLAVDKNPTLSEFYPFAKKQSDKGKYKIKTTAGKKGEALTIEQLQSLIDTETVEGLPEDESKKLWLFSFYCQGMNLRDIALLKYSNIDLVNGVISYVRQKTRETEIIETTMDIPLSESIKEIIISIGNPDKRPGSYVFPILTPGMSIERQDEVIKQKIKMINQRLKDLCSAKDLPEITTYWARHSYASLLKESGESIEMIRELLGHSDIRTTETYLKRFDIDRKRKVNERIDELFKKKSA